MFRPRVGVRRGGCFCHAENGPIDRSKTAGRSFEREAAGVAWAVSAAAVGLRKGAEDAAVAQRQADEVDRQPLLDAPFPKASQHLLPRRRVGDMAVAVPAFRGFVCLPAAGKVMDGCTQLEERKTGLSAEKYDRYADFTRRVIEDAVRVISEYGDISVGYGVEKKGDKVNHVIFHVRPESGVFERVEPLGEY